MLKTIFLLIARGACGISFTRITWASWMSLRLSTCAKLMDKLGTAASLLIGQFTIEDLLIFIEAYEGASGEDKSWTKAVASSRECEIAFPSMGLITGPNTYVVKIFGAAATATAAAVAATHAWPSLGPSLSCLWVLS